MNVANRVFVQIIPKCVVSIWLFYCTQLSRWLPESDQEASQIESCVACEMATTHARCIVSCVHSAVHNAQCTITKQFLCLSSPKFLRLVKIKSAAFDSVLAPLLTSAKLWWCFKPVVFWRKDSGSLQCVHTTSIWKLFTGGSSLHPWWNTVKYFCQCWFGLLTSGSNLAPINLR